MSKKSQLAPRPTRIHRLSQQEFRNCDAPNCGNIVSVRYLPPKFSGPVYCSLHRTIHT